MAVKEVCDRSIVFIKRPGYWSGYVGVAIPQEWLSEIDEVAGENRQEWLREAVQQKFAHDDVDEVDEEVGEFYREAIREELARQKGK